MVFRAVAQTEERERNIPETLRMAYQHISLNTSQGYVRNISYKTQRIELSVINRHLGPDDPTILSVKTQLN